MRSKSSRPQVVQPGAGDALLRYAGGQHLIAQTVGRRRLGRRAKSSKALISGPPDRSRVGVGSAGAAAPAALTAATGAPHGRVIDSTTLVAFANCSVAVRDAPVRSQPKSVRWSRRLPGSSCETSSRTSQSTPARVGGELRAQQRVAEGQQRPGPERDAGVGGASAGRRPMIRPWAMSARMRAVSSITVGALHAYQAVGAGLQGAGKGRAAANARRASRGTAKARHDGVGALSGAPGAHHRARPSARVAGGRGRPDQHRGRAAGVLPPVRGAVLLGRDVARPRCTMGTAQLLAYSTTSPERCRSSPAGCHGCARARRRQAASPARAGGTGGP